MLLNAGKKLKEACAARAILARELKLEGLSALFIIFSFILSGILFLFFGTVIFWNL